MKFGIIGLGRIGGNLARHAVARGHTVIGYARSAETRNALAGDGVVPADSLQDLVARLERPCIVMISVPHGHATQAVCDELLALVDEGDIVIDAGNSHWDDSRRRHDAFLARGIDFLDAGTSGGIEGALSGACFMVGGGREAFERVAPLLRELAIADAAVMHAGPPGAGHFTKLVHNAIEFGMVQSIAEGVELLESSDYDLDLPALFKMWNHGSVIRSWLVELMGRALETAAFDELSTFVEDTGEVKWIFDWSSERDTPTPVLTLSQQMLMQYRDTDSTTAKAVALLRHEFGGHPVHRTGGDPIERSNS
jgi:6-phosphogluconate dehydrogenase